MVDVSVRAEARKALAQFARLYPKEQRGQVVDIVSAHGVRCILNEVALEQLSPARLAEACEDAISELPAMLKPRPEGWPRRRQARAAVKSRHREKSAQKGAQGFRQAVPFCGRRAAGRGRRVEWRGF